MKTEIKTKNLAADNPVAASGLSDMQVCFKLHERGIEVDQQTVRKWRKAMPAWWATANALREIAG